MSGRHFVFLQGMPSPFFTRIARTLAAAGCRTTGINFCAGDALFWRGPATVNYRGRLADWPRFFADLIAGQGVTDVVLLGEQRSYHRPAVEIAQALGLRVTVTDFGYLRPDWITLEQDGMSGNSRFPRDPRQVLALAAGRPAPEPRRRYADNVRAMALADLAYNFANLAGAFLFPHYRRSDRRPPTIPYTIASGLRLAAVRLGRARTERRVAALAASGARYFIFPLQLEHDFQIVAYSPFADLGQAIRRVLASFSRHAGADCRLAIKVHPWDPGLRPWRRLIAGWADEAGVAGRVDVFDGGDLDTLIRNAVGMVTVNSTSGLRALQLGGPLIALGQAIYDLPGLAWQDGLDSFWRGAAPPRPALVDALQRALAATSQIRGSFFTEPGLSAAAAAAATRLQAGTVGVAMGGNP